MKVKFEKRPAFCVTTREDKILGGGVPVFLAEDRDEMEQVAGRLSRILDGVAHDLGNDVFLIVQH